MPIVIDGKTYRNLTEQVKKNMDDIKELQDKASGEVTKDYVDTQDEALQEQITENTTDITDLKSKTQTNTTDIASLETNKQDKLTQSQLNATNSGITADKVSKYDDYENTKQGKLTAGDNITISADNVISAAGGGSGSDVTKAYVDEQDAKLQQSINKTDTQVQKLNEDVTTIKTDTIPGLNDQLVATNTEVANKLDKATTTSGSYAYCRNGNKDETIPVNSLVGKDAIVRRTSTGTIKANAGVDDNDCVNKKQLNATDTQVQKLNEDVTTIITDTIPGLFSQENKWSVAQAYISMHDLVSVFNTAIEMQETPSIYKLGQLTIADDGTNETYINRYDLPIMKSQASRHTILTDKISAKVIKCTQSEYDGLTKDANTLYVIVG